MIENIFPPIPSEVILPFAGYLSYLGFLNFILVIIIGALGSALGSIVLYLIGLRFGRPFLEKYGKCFLINNKQLLNAEKWFLKNGDSAILLSKIVPGVRSLISIPAGIAKYRISNLFFYSFIGSLFWCFLLSWTGFVLGPYWPKIIEFLDSLDPLIFALICLMFFLIFKNSRNGSAEI
ncbi:MAG: DedA family protein [archaeon]